MSTNVFDKLNIDTPEHNTISDIFSVLEGYTNLGMISAEVKAHRKKSIPRQKEFESTLSKHQQKLYTDFSNDNSDEQYILLHEAFILGYKVATRLLIEGMK